MCRCALGLRSAAPVLHRDEMPDVARRARAVHVGADERCEVTAGARDERRRERHRHRETPRRVALRLFLVRDGEHALVQARRDELGRDDARGSAHRAGRVHAHHRLADGAERVGEVQLRHRDALEHVGRLADDDRVDVGPGHARVVERLLRGLAHEPRHRHVLARRAMHRLPDADDRNSLPCHLLIHTPPGHTPCSVAGTDRWLRGRLRDRRRRS